MVKYKSESKDLQDADLKRQHRHETKVCSTYGLIYQPTNEIWIYDKNHPNYGDLLYGEKISLGADERT